MPTPLPPNLQQRALEQQRLRASWVSGAVTLAARTQQLDAECEAAWQQLQSLMAHQPSMPVAPRLLEHAVEWGAAASQFEGEVASPHHPLQELLDARTRSRALVLGEAAALNSAVAVARASGQDFVATRASHTLAPMRAATAEAVRSRIVAVRDEVAHSAAALERVVGALASVESEALSVIAALSPAASSTTFAAPSAASTVAACRTKLAPSPAAATRAGAATVVAATRTSGGAGTSLFDAAAAQLDAFLAAHGGRTLGWAEDEHRVFTQCLLAGRRGAIPAGATAMVPAATVDAAHDAHFCAQLHSRHFDYRALSDVQGHLRLVDELHALEDAKRVALASWREQRAADAANEAAIAAARAAQERAQHQQAAAAAQSARLEHAAALKESVGRWQMQRRVAQEAAAVAVVVAAQAVAAEKRARDTALDSARVDRERHAAAARTAANNRIGFGAASNAQRKIRPTSAPAHPSGAKAAATTRPQTSLLDRRERDLISARARRERLAAADPAVAREARESRLREAGSRAFGIHRDPNRMAAEVERGDGVARLCTATAASAARRDAVEAPIADAQLCRGTNYLTPRTYVSHKGAGFLR